MLSIREYILSAPALLDLLALLRSLQSDSRFSGASESTKRDWEHAAFVKILDWVAHAPDASTVTYILNSTMGAHAWNAPDEWRETLEHVAALKLEQLHPGSRHMLASKHAHHRNHCLSGVRV